MSYTKFEYKNLKAEKIRDAEFEISFDVSNVGNMKAKEPVLLFVKQHFCKVTPFVRRLRKFTKIELDKGETKQIKFTLSAEDFSFINENMKKEIGKGKFTLSVADQSLDIEI